MVFWRRLLSRCWQFCRCFGAEILLIFFPKPHRFLLNTLEKVLKSF